jgi:hypothetical protein
MKKQLLFLSLAIAALTGGIFAQTNTPAAAVTSFYKFDRSHSQIFNRRAIDARKKWFSDSLYKLFLNELKREKEYLKQNPTDKPHFGDGLPFQPLDETCEANGKTYRYSYKIVPGIVNKRSATVSVRFSYPKQCSIDPMTYKFKLIKSGSAWLINDVEYPDDATLIEDLKRPVY